MKDWGFLHLFLMQGASWIFACMTFFNFFFCMQLVSWENIQKAGRRTYYAGTSQWSIFVERKWKYAWGFFPICKVRIYICLIQIWCVACYLLGKLLKGEINLCLSNNSSFTKCFELHCKIKPKSQSHIPKKMMDKLFYVIVPGLIYWYED